MNIMNINDLINQKKTSTAADTLLKTNNAPSFNQVLNNEKKSLIFNKKGKPKKISAQEYYSTSNSNKDLNKSDMQSNQIDTSNKQTSNLSVKETNKLYTYEEVDTENLEEILDNEFLDNFISLLQDLIINFNPDQIDTESKVTINIDLRNIELEGMDNLKDVLSLLLDKQNVDINNLMEVSLKKAISIATQILDNSIVSHNNIISLDKETIVDMLNTLKDLKNNPSVLLSNSSSIENNAKQNFNLKTKNNLVSEQGEKILNDDNVLTDVTNINIEDGTKIKVPVKTLLENFNEGQDFLRQEESSLENFVVNDNFLASQQEKVDQTINLNIMKNEIVEPKQFISEIAQKASAFLSKDRNEMNIQLTPENLGKISIKIGINDGTLTGKIYAENYSVKEIIESNLNQLRDALEENGLNIAGLEVNVGNNSQDFGSRMLRQSFSKKPNNKETSTTINSGYGTLEQHMNEINNPYLITNQFDGLV